MDASYPVRICVPVCERSLHALKEASQRAAERGDLIELRLDCLAPSEFERCASEITGFDNEIGARLILTLRPAVQGGHTKLDYSSRSVFWSTPHHWSGSYFMDLELDLVAGLTSAANARARSIDWSRVICSHHDFDSVPGDLEQIYERMADTPARVVKIAVKANDATDCIPVFSLLDRARVKNRDTIAIAMGTAGIATRVLGPSRGAFLTYGALETESASAPGQVTADELRRLYRIDKINRQTRITGLLGSPITQSISPHIHNAGFEALSIDGVYIPLEVKDLASFIRRMIHPRTRELVWNVCGLGVTAPYKTAVMNHLDWIEPAAREIGAVNTIVVRDNTLDGYNTDASAFLKTLLQVKDLSEARCAIIGTGGAARAALWGLQQRAAKVTVFGRDSEKARLLAQNFGGSSATLGSVPFDGFDVVINATPLGMSGKSEGETPATADQLRGAGLVYDLVYNPTETLLLREARAAGCQTLGGLAMLLAQAAEQFTLWTGAQAPEQVMHQAAAKALATKNAMAGSYQI